MNKKDKERAIRLNDCVHKIPKYVSGGTQSTTFISISNYSQDMAAFQDWLASYLYDTLTEAQWFNHPDNEFDFEDEFPLFVSPDEHLSNLEEWVEKRSQEKWAHVSSELGKRRVKI